MDIFFADPNDTPLPPNEVKIRSLEARPYPDGERVAVRYEITPFQKKPNIEINILNADDKHVANLSVVEAMEHKTEFTMHLRENNPGGQYTIKLRVFYANIDDFELGDRELATAMDVFEEVTTTIDTREEIFEVHTTSE